MNYKTLQKKRTYTHVKKFNLIYGQVGLLLLSPNIFTSKHLFRFILLIKKATRRTEKTFRFF